MRSVKTTFRENEENFVANLYHYNGLKIFEIQAYYDFKKYTFLMRTILQGHEPHISQKVKNKLRTIRD